MLLPASICFASILEMMAKTPIGASEMTNIVIFIMTSLTALQRSSRVVRVLSAHFVMKNPKMIAKKITGRMLPMLISWKMFAGTMLMI